MPAAPRLMDLPRHFVLDVLRCCAGGGRGRSVDVSYAGLADGANGQLRILRCAKLLDDQRFKWEFEGLCNRRRDADTSPGHPEDHRVRAPVPSQGCAESEARLVSVLESVAHRQLVLFRVLFSPMLECVCWRWQTPISA